MNQDNTIEFNKKHEAKKIKINLKKVNIFLSFFCVLSFAYYLIGSSSLSTKGFYLLDYRSTENELIRENEILENKVLALNSYENLLKESAKKDYVAISDIKYISEGNLIVAKK